MPFESFLVMAGLVILGALTLGPIGFFMVLGLRHRLRRAEQQLAALERQATRAALNEAAAALRHGPVDVPPEPAASPRPDEVGFVTPPAVPEAAEEPGHAAPPPPFAPPPAPPIAPPIEPPPAVVPQVATANIEPPAAPPPASLEERLGTRWAVWIGGVALGLGGLLLVRYSVEQGWFGPSARIFAGFLFAAGLVIAGEVLRRRQRAGTPTSGQIPAVLTAAGTVAAFGTVYAAHALYHFIGPGPAFLALGFLGLATMLAAALHGPALAGLGLLGAFVAPLLVQSETPDPWPVVIYIGFVTASAYGLARLRFWLWLALSAAAGSLLWGLVLQSANASGGVSAELFHALLQSLLAIALFVYGRRPAEPDRAADFDAIGWALPSTFALLTLVTLGHSVSAGGFGAAAVTVALAAAVPLAASGLMFAEVAALTLTAGALVLAILIIWPNVPVQSLSVSVSKAFWPAPNGSPGFGAFAVLTILPLAAAVTLRLVRSPNLRALPAALYAGAATLAPLAGLVIAYLRLKASAGSMLFAAIAAALAFVFSFAATVLHNRLQARNEPAFHLGLGAFAAAALAALSFGLVFALDRGMLTVAFALAALGASFVDHRLNIPALRWGVAGLGAIVAARLAIDPRVVGADLGTVPIFNWLLWGYGVPALAFAIAAELMRPRGEDQPVHVAQGLAILFAAFLVFFEIRHAVHGGDPFAPGSSLVEQGLLATAAFGYAILTTRLDALRTNPVLRAASLGFGVISFGLTLFGLLMAANPLFTDTPLEGGPLLNELALAYLLPAALAYLLARFARGVRPDWYGVGARICLHVLVFAFLNLELRRLFEGPELWLFGTYLKIRVSDAELYAYSALWLGLGIAYLGYGLLRHSTQARLISGLLVAASVFKVFVFDLASLQGILRALSFIGLGLVLMGVGFIYQKFVFARRTPQA
ncbi:MAG: DUF2339 domain-containing protein [Beijerinckiaceae bacterium]